MPKMNAAKRQSLLWVVLLAMTISAPFATAEERTPTTTESTTNKAQPSAISHNTNPAQRDIIPRKGQTEEQKLSDQLECYDWTCEMVDWDPYQAYDALVEEGYAVALSRDEIERGLICLSAQGAVAGAVVGEILDDVENGAAIGAAIGVVSGLIQTQYLTEPENPQAQRSISRFERNLEKWERKFAGCMSRKGYRVLSD